MAARGSTSDSFVGPLSKAEHEQLHPRADKPDLLAEVAAEDEEWVEFERMDERDAVQAGTKVWTPIQPPFIDSHFSLWSLSTTISSSQLYLGGKLPPGPDTKWGQILRRDFTMDDYEEEVSYMRVRAENEIKYEVGELNPIRYGICVQTASTYSEGLVVSSMAEDYYCIAGFVSWCDLSDPGLSDRLKQMTNDPLLVGVRYDISEMESDYLLDPTIDENFSIIEYYKLPFDLCIGPHQLRHACQIAYRHPKLKLILNHCGLPVEYTASRSTETLTLKNWRSDLEYLSRYPNVYCKVTGATGVRIDVDPESDDAVYMPDPHHAQSVLTHAISCFGPDRCIFGSGWPLCQLIQPNQTGWLNQARTASDLKGCDIPGELAAKRKRRSVPLTVLNMWEAARLVENAMGEAGFGSMEDKIKVFSTNVRSVYSLTIRPYGSCPKSAPV